MRSLETLSARTLTALLCAAVLAACGGHHHGTNETSDGEAVDGELNVGVRAGSIPNAAVEALISQVGAALIADPNTSFYRVSLKPGVTPDQARRVLVHPDIVVVEPNYLAWGYAAPNDPMYDTSQYNATVQAELEAAWDAYALTTLTRGPVVIAVLDTGVRATHEDLVKVDPTDWQDYVALGNTVVHDDHGHGTQLAGIAAAEVNNGTGIAGVASWDGGTSADPGLVTVMPVKVADASNVSNHAAIAAGMSWAVAHGANIVLVSLGSKTPSWTLQSAIQQAHAAGVLVVAAAGNDGTATMRYPAAYQSSNQNVLSVTSANAADAIDVAHKTNWGSWVNVLAPGAGLTATSNLSDTDYATSLVGSSYAAAHVAGVAALVWSAYLPTTAHQTGYLTVDEVRNAVLAGVDSYDRANANSIAASGGRVNAAKALAAAANITTHATNVRMPGSVVFSSVALRGGATATGTVVLTDAAQFITTVSVAANDPHLTIPNPIVTIPAGFRSATFGISTTPVAATTHVTVTATHASGVQATGRIDLTSPGVARVTLSPSTVVGGANVSGTVTLAGAAPVGNVDVTLDDGGNSYVSFAATTVTVAAGQTSATFTVNTQVVPTVQRVTIGATANGTSASATLTVNPVLAGVSFTPAQVKGGSSSTLKISLNGAAQSDLVIDVEFDDSTHVLDPATYITTTTVPRGSSSKSVIVTSLPVAGAGSARVRASYHGGPQTAWAYLTVNTPSIGTVTATTGSLVWWDASHVSTGIGTVTLDANVATTTAVYLVANDSSLAIPAMITIPPGSRSATFLATPAAVVGSVTVSVAASLTPDFAVKKACTFSLKPALQNMTLASAQVAGGTTVHGTVTLSAAAPAGGFAVALASDGPRGTVDPSVTVSVGATTAQFDVTTDASPLSTTVNISASANGVVKTVALKLTSPAISTVQFSPTTANVGDTVTGTITLGVAAVGRTAITITATDTTAVPVSGFSPVYIATTQTQATFTFTVGAVTAQKTVTVTATLNGTPKTASLTVRPAPVTVTLASASVAGGSSVNGTITLASAAPAGGTVVTLAGTDPATVSTTRVTIPQNGRTANFTVTTVGVDVDTVTSVAATTGTTTSRAMLTVRAPTVASVTPDPMNLSSAASPANVTITLSANPGPGGVTITLDPTNLSTSIATLGSPSAWSGRTATVPVTWVDFGDTTFDVQVLGSTATVHVHAY